MKPLKSLLRYNRYPLTNALPHLVKTTCYQQSWQLSCKFNKKCIAKEIFKKGLHWIYNLIFESVTQEVSDTKLFSNCRYQILIATLFRNNLIALKYFHAAFLHALFYSQVYLYSINQCCKSVR